MPINVTEILISAKDQTASGFDSAKTGIDNLHGKVTALAGALAGGMFAKMIVDSMDAADQIGKLAQSTGVSTEALSRMSVSAKLSDVDMEALAKSMGKLSKNVIDAADGTGSGKKAFDAMGISIKDANGHLKSNDVVMAEVADKFANMHDGAGKTALAMDIFGKSGAAMIPMLNSGSAALKENADLADKLGLTLSKNTTAAAEAVNDRFTTMGLAGKGIANTIMQQMLPTFDNLSKVMVDSATNADGLKKIAEGLDVTLKSLVSGGIIVSSIFSTLGNILGGVAASIVLAMQGEFSAAKNALSDMGSTMVSNMSSDMGSIAKVWEQNTPKVTAAAEESAKTTFNGYGEAAKAAIATAAKEQYATVMAMLESDLKTQGDYAKQAVKQINAKFAMMRMSEAEFYSAKRQLALEALATEQGFLETELALARHQQDKKKEIELLGKIERNKAAQGEGGGADAYDIKAQKASQSAFEIEQRAQQDRLDLATRYRALNGDADGRAKQMLERAQAAHEAAMEQVIRAGGLSTAQKQVALEDLAAQRVSLETALAMARMKNDKLKEIELQGKIERNKLAKDDVVLGGGASAVNKAAQTPLEIEKKAYKDRLDLATQYRALKGDADGRAKQMEAEAQDAHEAAMEGIVRKGGLSRAEFEALTAKQQFGYHVSMLQQTLGASSTHSRAAFELMKMTKLAEAAIALPSTVMKAYESGMAAGGPAGPVVGAAYAAVALATQLAQISSINSASFGGGASAAAAPSAGGVSNSAVLGQTANPNQVGQTNQAAQAPAQPVNVYVTGNVMSADFVINTIIPEIKNQITNADVTIIDPRSRQAQMLAVPA